MSLVSTTETFSFDERLGIYFTVQSSCLSAAAVTILLGYAVYRQLKRMRLFLKTDDRSASADLTDSSLFLNLMVADLIQAIGGMPNIRWMKQGHITEGQLCTAQAIIKQIGINGVALSSLAIAIHTFCVLALRWRAPRHVSKFMVLGIWVFIALVVGIPNAVHKHHQYYGSTGYWCWIVTKYKTEQIVSEYLWVWMAAIVMAVLYGIMYLVMRGFVTIDNGFQWSKSEDQAAVDVEAGDSEEDKESREIANLLLFYPAVYIVCVFPNTLSRWLYFSGRHVPNQFTLFASALFAFSGMFNVILFFWTRPELVVGQQSPAGDVNPHAAPSQPPHSQYGHLPHKEISESAASDLEKVQLTRHEKILPELTIHQSPSPAGLSLGHTSPVSAKGNLSTLDGRGDRQERSTISHRSDDDDDEEDYGRLPG